MIKVAIIGGKIHSGGKKNLIMEYFRHIDRSQVQFDFICDSDSNSIPDDEIAALGGRVFRITPYQNIVGNMRDMYRLFKANGYDVVHAWNSMMNVFPMVVARMAGIPVRINESLSMATKGEAKTYIKYALRPFSSVCSTHFMACGEDCGVFQFGRRALDRGDIAIFKTVINGRANAYDPDLRQKTRRAFGWDDSTPVYGFIGRYMKQKNPLFLMRIMGAIAALQPQARFVTIGFGNFEPEMMKLARELGFADRLDNLGRREDIRQFYNAFDAFLLPSLYEGLPVVGLEAQACGLPIFFSTEVTAEAAVCDLATFVPLAESPESWARIIIDKVAANIPVRRSHVAEIENSGYDSHTESQRLLDYYRDNLKRHE